MKTLFLTVLSVGALLTANAQTTDSKSHTASMVLANVITLDLQSGDLTMNFSTATDYSSGVVSASKNLTVNSNRTYSITALASSTGSFTGFTAGDLVGTNGFIPLSKLTVSTDGGSTYKGLSATSGQPTAIVTAHAAGAAIVQAVKYKADPGFAYAADTYTTTITYTATQD